MGKFYQTREKIPDHLPRRRYSRLDQGPREERWITLGKDAFDRLLIVVYTWRGERIRLISARRATARERQQYEERDET